MDTSDKIKISSLNDDEIIEFLEEKDSQDDYDLFVYAISKLSEPSNIIQVLSDYFDVDDNRDREVFESCIEKFHEADDDDITSFLGEVNYGTEFCKALVPKINDVSEINDVLSNINFDDNKELFLSLIPIFEDADDDDITSFLGEVNYGTEFCKALVPNIKDLSKIVDFLSSIYLSDDREVFEICLDKFKDADDEEIKSFLYQAGCDAEFCKVLVPKMKDTSEILEILSEIRIGNNRDIFESCLDKFKDAGSEEINSFLNEAGYDEEFCKVLIPKMDDISEILEILSEISISNDPEVFEACVDNFKNADDEDIERFLRESGYDPGLCRKLLPFIDSGEVKENIFNEVPCLKENSVEGEEDSSIENELMSNEIFESTEEDEVREESNASEDLAKEEDNPPSDYEFESLEEKSDSELVDLLRKSEVEPDLYKYYVGILPFGSWSEYRVINFLEKMHFESRVCLVALPHIKSEYILDSNLDKFPNDKEFIEALIPRLYLDKKSEYQLTTLLKRLKYSLELCKACIPLLASDTVIFSVMKETRYDSEVCSLGLIRLRNLLK